VLDPTFNSGNNYLAVLEALAEHRYTGKLALQCRMEMVTEPFLDVVHKLNKTAKVVLEFGLQTIHREEQLVIRRLNNMTKVSEVLNKSRDMGIETEVSLIFGLPKQTVTSFQASVDFCKSMQVQTIHAFPLMLLRGTPLYESKIQYSLIESCDDPNIDNGRIYEDIPHVISSPTFTYDDWLVMASIARELETYNEANKQKKITEATLADNPFGLFRRTQSTHRIIETSNDYPFAA
jgi:coproporphyrinogen III oxidase-like Fe-S oxidoreductase